MSVSPSPAVVDAPADRLPWRSLTTRDPLGNRLGQSLLARLDQVGAQVRLGGVRKPDPARGVLMVLEQGDDGAADGHGGAVEGVQRPVALWALDPAADAAGL